MDLREHTMEYRKLKTINDYIRKSVNPAKSPDTLFEMYSVPIFETGHPEYLLGREIASNKTVVQKNDILLCKINPRINRVWIVADESENPNIASSEWIVVRSSKYNPEFLAWYFRSPRFKNLMTSEVTGIGGSLTRAQPKSVAEYPVPVLEKPEQDAIAIIFNTVDTIIKKRRKQLQKLDELIKARFVEMFGDPVKNSKRLPTVLGETLFRLSNGKALPSNERFPEGIPAYGGNGVSWYTEKILCDFDTIIVGRVGFQSGNVHLAKAPLWVTDNAMYISSLNTEICDMRFLCALMEHIDFTRYQDAGDLKKITQKPFMQMHYPMPSMQAQMQYIDFSNQVDKTKVAVQKALDEAQLLFDSLMQKYFG